MDGSSFSWPDGELVTPDKLASWLKEDILLRRVKLPGRKPYRRKPRSIAVRKKREQEDAEALAQAKTLAETSEVPLSEIAELLADDREGYVPPVALVPAGESAEAEEPVKGAC
jgi:hypothetical protein